MIIFGISDFCFLTEEGISKAAETVRCSMKKLLCILLCGLMCLSISGCKISIRISDSEYALREYDDDEKIAKNDFYDDGDTYTNRSDGVFWGDYEKFKGRRTIVTIPSDEVKEITLKMSLWTDEGKVKIVFVDPELNVTTLFEYECGDTSGQYSAELNTSVKLQKGENLFKIVGYDCKNLKVQLYWD